MEPPRPDLEVPDPIYKAPLFPEDPNPVLRTRSPLSPAVPASDVRKISDPLVDEEP